MGKVTLTKEVMQHISSFWLCFCLNTLGISHNIGFYNVFLMRNFVSILRLDMVPWVVAHFLKAIDMVFVTFFVESGVVEE